MIALVDTLQPSAQLLGNVLKEFSSAQVQMKPGAGRLQLDVPLPPMGPNVNADEVPMKQRKHLRLISSPAELPTSFAVGARPRLPGVAKRRAPLLPGAGAVQVAVLRLPSSNDTHAEVPMAADAVRDRAVMPVDGALQLLGSTRY